MRFSTLWGLAPIAAASLHASEREADGLVSRSDHGYAPNLQLGGAILTSKWIEGSDYTQIIEFILTNNHASNYLTAADTLNITLNSDSLDLVLPATSVRLAPKQSQVLQIGVKNKSNAPRGSQCSGTLVATYGQTYGNPIVTTTSTTGYCGIPDYTADTNSLGHHWVPDWWRKAAFGIFIHWGIFSVPAYGNTGSNEDYAEWYWCRMHDPNYRSQTYEYHEKTYGASFNYDQFMNNFTAANYNQESWVNLFAKAGAGYFVPVFKHHEGFSLYNTASSITQRSSMHYGPKRDLYGELFAAAKQYQPQIRRGSYFSMPEWYNPGYYKYRNSNPSWGGGCFGQYPGPYNPYTNENLEYTGYVQQDDYILDTQLPQMNELAYDYGTDIMWCDIGGPNNMTIFASKWLNWARDNGRQVTYNGRCGISAEDFSTPEYTTNAGIVGESWETNRGMDPFSFGYNAQTPDSEYLTGNDIVQTLVDSRSKNGNFLLDIGPKADGTIPDIMQQGLTDAGSWILERGESIYDIRYWNSGPGQGNFRYTVSSDTKYFYIHYLTQPGTTITITDPVPWLPGDTVTVLGGKQNGAVVPTVRDNSGHVILTLTNDIINGDRYVWTFRIAYTSTW